MLAARRSQSEILILKKVNFVKKCNLIVISIIIQFFYKMFITGL